MSNQNNFNRFDEIENVSLRVFNRSMLMQNLMADFGRDVMTEYASLFNEQEVQQIFIMNTYIQTLGVEEVRKMVQNGLKVDYDVSEEA